MGTPIWINELKEELASIVHREVNVLAQRYQDPRSFKHPNFRTVNGLPICFYCKRLGHVKKYCRSHLARSEQRRPKVVNETLGLPQVNEMTFDKEEMELSEQAAESASKESIVVIGQLFMRIQAIMDEITGMVESSIKAPVHKVTDEFDRALFKGALLDVVKRVSSLNNALDVVDQAEKRSSNFTGRCHLERLEPVHGLGLFSENSAPRDSIT